MVVGVGVPVEIGGCVVPPVVDDAAVAIEAVVLAVGAALQVSGHLEEGLGAERSSFVPVCFASPEASSS